MLPECFGPTEKPLVARSIHTPTAAVASHVKRWLQESGGVDGKPLAIHANWLFPYDRVRSRLEELLG